MKLFSLHWLHAAALCVFIAPATAADYSSAGPSPDALGTARTLIASKKWPAAIDELKRVNLTDNADWNNLMGYSARKAAAPDLAAAERHYTAALRIDSKHRGALEYSGELYLMMGDVAKAEERLAQLGKVCVFGCEEYTDLKKAMQQYKANGKKLVAAP